MATKRQKISNVPNLRFTGFEGEWVAKKFGEVATNKSGKYNPTSARSSIKCIELEHLVGESGQLLGYIDGSRSGSIKNIFSKGDVLFGKLRPYLRKYLQAPFDGVCSSEIWVLKGTEVSNDFLYQIVQTDKFIDLANQSSGSKMPRADWSVVEKGIFSFPTITEQQKISRFLSLLDSRIATQNKIIQQLETLMLGLRDKLLIQKMRFEDENGNVFPDWQMKRLVEVASKKSSNISANKIEDNFGEFIIYGASGILKHVDFYEEEHDYVSVIKDGAGVGRLLYCNGKSSVLGTMEIIKPKEKLNTYFLYCLLTNIDFVKYITGSTIPHIYFKDYSNELCGIPCLKEQTKIANFLSYIDNKVDTEKRILMRYETQKNYLLQNMFV